MLTYDRCTLCPRMCGVDRTAGQTGFCGMPAGARVARAAPHFWEEPAISGGFGSGAVFFSGCTLGCCFCQNEPVSHGGYGVDVTEARLREIFENLIEKEGVGNLNLVTATQFLPSILPALEPKLPVPVVYNTGGYERVETLRELEGLVQVYLPDLKYGSDEAGRRLSGVPDYFSTAAAAITEMVRQVGPVRLDEDGNMVSGVLIRHLVLPGQTDSAMDALDWIANSFPRGTVWVSLMSQYTPMGRAKTMPPLDRRITEEEYDIVRGWLDCRGLRDGYLQDFSSAQTEYVPEFNGEGVL